MSSSSVVEVFVSPQQIMESSISIYNSVNDGLSLGFGVDGSLQYSDFANSYNLVATILGPTALGPGAAIANFGMQTGVIFEEYGRVGSVSTKASAEYAGAIISGAAAIAVLAGAPAWVAIAGAAIALGLSTDEAQAIIADVYDVLSDEQFYSDLSDNAKALADDLLSGFEEAMSTLGEAFSALGDVVVDPDFWASYFHYATNLGEIYPAVSSYFEQAGIIQALKDPLALDLNHDGLITTISADDGITFDHGATGVEYGTGWLNPADAWLALDLNGNGVIDSGRELFGDNTIKLDGNRATDAFDALASFDTNADGKIDAADATGDTDNDGVIEAGETFWDVNHTGVFDAGDKTFADLRLWQDVNSDGNSAASELLTLTSQSIVSIKEMGVRVK